MTAALLAALLPLYEMQIIERIALSKSLSPIEKALLISIRRTENGRPHIAFGIMNPKAMIKDRKSYERQCRWCADTIRKRYRNNLSEFANRYCPYNSRSWENIVRYFLKKQGVNDVR